MKALLEITQWTSKTPNHTYLVNDSKEKLYAYIKVGTKDVVELAKPIKFSTRGRKFKEIENTFGYSVDDKPEGRTWKVAGSRGDSYTVSEHQGNWMCTCAGFKFRGQCKHVDELSQVK